LAGHRSKIKRHPTLSPAAKIDLELYLHRKQVFTFPTFEDGMEYWFPQSHLTYHIAVVFHVLPLRRLLVGARPITVSVPNLVPVRSTKLCATGFITPSSKISIASQKVSGNSGIVKAKIEFRDCFPVFPTSGCKGSRPSWPKGKSRRCRAFAAPECFDFSEFHTNPVQSVFIAMSKDPRYFQISVPVQPGKLEFKL
jgi:hypothetical protein